MRFESIYLGRFELRLYRDLLGIDSVDVLWRELIDTLPWRQEHIRLFGRERAIPRLQCWIGDVSAIYRYSGLTLHPEPWPPHLWALKLQLETTAGQAFNSVLCNRYRNGQDSMGWHSDNEPELGPAPVIASVTLGATRRFQFRARHDRQERLSIDLPHNSLLLMPAGLQAEWQHQVPKTRRRQEERLNLTFRYVFPESAAND